MAKLWGKNRFNFTMTLHLVMLCLFLFNKYFQEQWGGCKCVDKLTGLSSKTTACSLLSSMSSVSSDSICNVANYNYDMYIL